LQVTRAEDRFGHEIEAGDTVEFVYGGDRHSMHVTGVDQDGPHTVVEGTIKVGIHDKSAARTARKKAVEKKSPVAEKPAAAAAETKKGSK
jgi:plastocyanin